MAATSADSSQTTLEQLVTTWVVSGRDEEIAEAVLEVSEGRLLSVVKALGTYLTAEQDDLRTKGVDFLATVITRCPPDSLNRQSVKVLTVFFCDKLEDTETIIPALKGLASLPSICSSADALVMIKAVFAHVKMRALVQSVRFHVFTIIDGLIANHRETLKGMKSEFILPYIYLAEGEKDPRNLLVAFAIARVIVVEFDCADHIEALSNIIFCYFPITFRPPPNDPYGITADDLRDMLRRCLSAHPSFGPIGIPIFLEKMAAGSPAIKRDTLQTMAECFPVYGSTFLRTSARKLWNAIKLEIFQPTDSITEGIALVTIQALVKTIHSEDDSQDEEMQGLARDACEECIGILREPEKSQAKPAIKVLCAFMATTPSVARFTLAHAVPHLLKLFADPKEVPSRQPVLLLLSDIVAAARDSLRANSDQSMTDTEGEPPLALYKDEVLGVLVSGLAATPTTRAALAGLTGLVSTPNLLSDAEVGFIVLKVNEVLQNSLDEEHSDDRNAVLKLLMTISSTSPTHVRDQTLPLLLSDLPDVAPPRDALGARARYQHVLSALSTLCGPPALFECLVGALAHRLATLALSQEGASDFELSAAYLHALLSAVKRALAAKVDENHTDVAGYADTFVPALYGLCVRAALKGGPAREPRVIGASSDIVRLVVQSLTPVRQQEFASALFSAFLQGRIDALCLPEHVSMEDGFSPFAAKATTDERKLLALFEAGTTPLHPSVTIDPDINACTEGILLQGLTHTDNEQQVNAVLRVVGSIVNKHADELGLFLEQKKAVYWPEQILNQGASPERRRHAIKVWTWISKGLLVRNHTQANDFIQRLFDAFSDDVIGADAAKAFGDIAATDNVLTKRNSAIVKFLWAQKFTNGILPRLMSGAKDDSDAALQRAHLIALTSLLKAVPNTVYAHEMAQLLPLLLRALHLPDPQIRANVLETLLSAVVQHPSTHAILEEHASALARQLLTYTSLRNTPMTSTRIRIAALRCLGALPGVVRYDVLHPCKADVLRALVDALDDPKRDVRREAVDARSVTFNAFNLDPADTTLFRREIW
ncbi:MMS19 nucleotide excision repair [Favolaschia claudopus]|uniref:MMS19 nucleotide excision repair protein n=1 Tax=Favolaschia claudopus TaxID=2862362 RepID=A0AAW0CNG8_9AGAR